ncbi:hypothetical protein LQZ21_14125 [Treponema sp. TIM-1]|uniref:hypothetical protein n=1 Tax=Treponema sp. TIM-1 TaxID=2898417 RepID=UPI003980BD99
MMIRNYVLALVLALLGFAAAVLFCGGMFGVYIDLPNALLIIIFPLAYQWILFGKNFTGIAFTAPFKKEPSLGELSKSQVFFKSYRKLTWITALVVIIIAMIAMLMFLENRSALGPNMAIAFISTLYAGLIDILVIFPYTIILKKRMLLLDEEI